MLTLVWMMVALVGTPSDPLWISAESITARDGSLDLSRVPGRARKTLKSYLSPAGPEPGCFGGIVGAPVTSDQPAADRRAFYTGTIVAIENGFYEGHPGALLQVSVHTRIGKAALPDASLRIFYPRAEFRIGGHTFCAGSRGMHTAEIGQRVVLMLHRAVPANAPFLYPADDELYFEGSDSALYSRRDRPPN